MTSPSEKASDVTVRGDSSPEVLFESPVTFYLQLRGAVVKEWADRDHQGVMSDPWGRGSIMPDRGFAIRRATLSDYFEKKTDEYTILLAYHADSTYKVRPAASPDPGLISSTHWKAEVAVRKGSTKTAAEIINEELGDIFRCAQVEEEYPMRLARVAVLPAEVE